jgi:hypothetical protein
MEVIGGHVREPIKIGRNPFVELLPIVVHNDTPVAVSLAR